VFGWFRLLLSISVSLAQTDRQRQPQPSFQPLSPQQKFDYYISSTFSPQDVLNVRPWPALPNGTEAGIKHVFGKRK
jgi:hypothetical protein